MTPLTLTSNRSRIGLCGFILLFGTLSAFSDVGDKRIKLKVFELAIPLPGAVTMDATVENNFFNEGPYFLSGETTSVGLFPRVSFTYNFK